MSNESLEFKIIRVIEEEITTPSLDGSRGSALYSVPFELSKSAPSEWSEYFVQSWNNPPVFSTRHRPGIARAYEKKIILDGTTVEEVENVHKQTLELCVQEANKSFKNLIQKREQQRQFEQKKEEEHKKNVSEVSKRIRFE